MADDAVNQGLLLFQRGVLGGNGGGNGSDGKLAYFIPPLNYRPLFDLQNSALLAFIWQPVSVWNFNAGSNPNGLISKIIRALQLDQFVKGLNLEGIKRHLHEIEAENVQVAGGLRPTSTPGSAAGQGYSGQGPEIG